jgi:hypothetical protein
MQQMMSWSVIALSQVGLKNVHGFYATRALLGLLEGYVSIYPFGEPIYRQEMSFTSTVVSSPTLFCEPTSFGWTKQATLTLNLFYVHRYLSYYFTASELSIRLGFFWVALTTTSILGSFLAAGLLAMRGTHGLEGWRWLFLVEGIITFFIGLWAYFYLPAGPTQTAGGIRGKGWFTELVDGVSLLAPFDLAHNDSSCSTGGRKLSSSTRLSEMIRQRAIVRFSILFPSYRVAFTNSNSCLWLA